MSTPQQPPPQQPPPNQAQQAVNVALIATALMAATGPAAAVALLAAKMKISKDLSAALFGSFSVAMAMPPEQTGVIGSASINAHRTNTIRRAQFVWSSSRRLLADIISARSRGVPIGQALAAGIVRERRYYGQHRNAMWQRADAAAQVDMMSLTYGDLLGWNAVMDSRTSKECRAANGKNFEASSVPLIGYPGSVHPHCRCWPGAPHPGARMLPSARPEYVRAA